jgi:hypothetical protein
MPLSLPPRCHHPPPPRPAPHAPPPPPGALRSPDPKEALRLALYPFAIRPIKVAILSGKPFP